MKRSCRLTRSTDIQRVRRNGKSYAHPFVVLLVTKNDHNKVRIGITAGMSVGKAVDRNKAKRRLRNALSTFYSSLAPGNDLLVLARKPIVTVPYEAVITAVESLLNRANLVTHDG